MVPGSAARPSGPKTGVAGSSPARPTSEGVIATVIDEQGLSVRVGPNQLGHSKVSMTQDRYMKHTEVAALMNRTVGINDE